MKGDHGSVRILLMVRILNALSNLRLTSDTMFSPKSDVVPFIIKWAGIQQGGLQDHTNFHSLKLIYLPLAFPSITMVAFLVR